MILLRFINWLLGFVIIDVSQGFTERFINLLSGIGVSTWGIKQTGAHRLRLRLRARQFKRIRKIVFKTKVKVKIVKKKGLPFYLFRYRKRKGFLAGLVIFLALLITPTFFIWQIEVTGNNGVPDEVILQAIAADGIKVGMSNLSVKKKEAQMSILRQFDSIIWTKISVKGSRLVVDVREGVLPPELITDEQVCNIVAKKDGQITAINVMRGTKMQNKGDIVKKGDLLVSGVVDTREDGPRYVHAMAEVKADTLTLLKAEVPLVLQENVPTGRVYHRFYLQFLNYSVKLYINDKIKYKLFEKTEFSESLSVGDYFYFPIGYKKEVIKETSPKEIRFSEEEAKNAVMVMLTEKERIAFQGLFVKDRQVSVTVEDGKAVAQGSYICSEDIAEKVVLN